MKRMCRVRHCVRGARRIRSGAFDVDGIGHLGNGAQVQGARDADVGAGRTRCGCRCRAHAMRPYVYVSCIRIVIRPIIHTRANSTFMWRGAVGWAHAMWVQGARGGLGARGAPLRVIQRPFCGVVGDVGADGVSFTVIADEVFVIVALPDGFAWCFTEFVNLACDTGFISGQHRSQ